MTVVVTFLCTDGVVVAADSMLTTSLGNMNIAHHTGKKLKILNGSQVFAFAGDQGLGERFRIMADRTYAELGQKTDHPIDYPIQLTNLTREQFQVTGINDALNLNAVLAYIHGNKHHCCIFEGPLQPRLLDEDHFYCSLGIGKLAADPFLRFLVDIFCKDRLSDVHMKLPDVHKGARLATWAIEYVIQTIPGGVAYPIRIGILERTPQGHFIARELSDEEIEFHSKAFVGACESLQSLGNKILTGAAADEAEELPQLER